MSAGVLVALRRLETRSSRFDVWAVAGPHNAWVRQEIMSALEGRKVPKAAAGVNALRAKLWGLVPDLPNDCLAVQERAFAAWARAQVGEASP